MSVRPSHRDLLYLRYTWFVETNVCQSLHPLGSLTDLGSDNRGLVNLYGTTDSVRNWFPIEKRLTIKGVEAVALLEQTLIAISVDLETSCGLNGSLSAVCRLKCLGS